MLCKTNLENFRKMCFIIDDFKMGFGYVGRQIFI